MTKAIWFDMDGTIADLYGVIGWLESIIARETRPYEVAKGIGNLALIARLLNKVQKKGYTVKVKEGNELDIAYVYDRDGNLMYACNALDVDLVARVMGLL